MHHSTRQPSDPFEGTPQVVLQHLLEQGSSALNEDALCISDTVFGVFDGATSLDGGRYTDGTGGLLAASLAAETFATAKTSLLDTAAKANNRIRAAQLARGLSLAERHRLWSTTAAVVRVNGEQMEYVLTGDAMILALYEDGRVRPLAQQPDIDRETMRLWRSADVQPGETIQGLLGKQIRRVRLEMNRSYGVLNGEPEALDFLVSGTLSLAGVSSLLLFTDGLFPPCTDPDQAPDWHAWGNLYRQGGLQAMRDRVRALQVSDPTCRLYPRFKLHDDIASISLDFLAEECAFKAAA